LHVEIVTVKGVGSSGRVDEADGLLFVLLVAHGDEAYPFECADQD
jgi:hypothetical protein